MLSILATAGLGETLTGGGTGGSVWQSIGGLIAVFGILIVCMKLLTKLKPRNRSKDTDLLAVWQLGPKREIQVLRLGDEVHYIYRHDGAMVPLKQEPFVEWQRIQETNLKNKECSAGFTADLLKKALPFVRLPGISNNPTDKVPAA